MKDNLEFETAILHLIRTQKTCKLIAEDMINLAQKFGWMDEVKIGLPESYVITEFDTFVMAEYKGCKATGHKREVAIRNLEIILREQNKI
jgi:hypothetical protein